MTRLLVALLGVLCLSAPARADDLDDLDEEDEEDEEVEDLDAPERPKSPREGTTFTVTVPLGYGAGGSGGGVAYGLSGAIGGGALSVPVYLVLADGGRVGGQYMIGLRYNAPKVFFVEALAGWAKPYGHSGASLGVGGGLGVDIPVYRRFTITVGGTVSYAFAQSGVFGLAYAGPSLHF